MSGIASPQLSASQVTTLLTAVSKRLQLSITSPTRLLPGKLLTATLLPAVPEIDASDLMNGILNVAWLAKDVLYKDLNAVSIGGTDTAPGAGALDGDKILSDLESVTGTVLGKPFPQALTTVTTPAGPNVPGLAAQLAGTISLPRLNVTVKIKWIITDKNGKILDDGTDMVALNGLALPALSVMLPPPFRELRMDKLANPGGDVFCLSAQVTLSIADQTPLPTFTLGPVPILQVPVLVPTVVAMFSEPNFGVTGDSAVVLMVPAHSPFASAAPLFKELQRIESLLDTIRGIAGIAGFLLGLNELLDLTNQPRLRFVAADSIPKLGEIVLKRKPWYYIFGSDDDFDDKVNSLFVFGIPGTRVTFYNDTYFKIRPDSKQGFYEIELRNAIDTTDIASPLPDFFVAIKSFATEAMVDEDSSLSNRVSAPITFPAGRIVNFEPDDTGDEQWDTDLSSVQFSINWLQDMDREKANPDIPGILTCFGQKPPTPPRPDKNPRPTPGKDKEPVTKPRGRLADKKKKQRGR